MAKSREEAEMAPSGGDQVESRLNELIVPEQTIDNAGFDQINTLLNASPQLSKWHGCPRVFSLLRMAGCAQDDNIAAAFISEGVNDQCIPLSEKYLPIAIKTDPELVDRVLKYQPFVLTRLGTADSFHGSSFVLGESTGHRHIEDGRLFFDQLKLLGNGASAQVHRVEHKDSKVHFARKRIERGGNLKEQRSQLKEFEQELDTLRRLHHRHLVRCYGSYTDRASFALLIWPIADHDAQKPLHEQVPAQLTVTDRDNLRRAFGCLTSGVVYVHKNNTRHKDIKPGNILVSNNSVFLCDFGVSMAWSTEGHSTTEDKVFKHTEKYSPREVADAEPRNTAADIWSLGCVFLEMITVIKGISVKDMEAFLLQRCDHFKTYWHVTDDIPAWLDYLESMTNTYADHDENDDAPLEWVRLMVS
ncbi:kinase-like protein [Lophium mytilinum]|uniref:mitogen-activated protein kinase n=1 Tax=Lophium mytilinum TaxID=390894 RepID=A0A6A6R958_9PEZI|nr:kinase-like protein [Lophium mytilinum]